MAKDVVAHREYSTQGKIDPAGIDMNGFRADVQNLIDQSKNGAPAPQPGGSAVSDPIADIHFQTAEPHPIRQVFQKTFYNLRDGKLWLRAGLADVWNEMVWDGYINPVDLLDGKDDPDIKPDSPNRARRGSVVSYVLATYREATLARRYAERNNALLEALAKKAGL